MLQFVDTLKQSLEHEHRKLLSHIETLPEGEVITISEQEELYALHFVGLPRASRTLAAWVYWCSIRDSFSNCVGNWSGDGFVSLSQFSLSQHESLPVFVASGLDGVKVLQIVRKAIHTFKPEMFDCDGYVA